MTAFQVVDGLFGLVPAFVWIGLVLILALLIVYTVIQTKRRNREVAELDKLFPGSGDFSSDSEIKLERRRRRQSGTGKASNQEAESGKKSLAHDKPQEREAVKESEMEESPKGETAGRA